MMCTGSGYVLNDHNVKLPWIQPSILASDGGCGVTCGWCMNNASSPAGSRHSPPSLLHLQLSSLLSSASILLVQSGSLVQKIAVLWTSLTKPLSESAPFISSTELHHRPHSHRTTSQAAIHPAPHIPPALCLDERRSCSRLVQSFRQYLLSYSRVPGYHPRGQRRGQDQLNEPICSLFLSTTFPKFRLTDNRNRSTRNSPPHTKPRLAPTSLLKK